MQLREDVGRLGADDFGAFGLHAFTFLLLASYSAFTRSEAARASLKGMPKCFSIQARVFGDSCRMGLRGRSVRVFATAMSRLMMSRGCMVMARPSRLAPAPSVRGTQRQGRGCKRCRCTRNPAVGG